MSATGRTGVIGTNKPDGATAAEQILEDIATGRKSGRDGFENLLRRRGVRWVDFAAWKNIDAAEIDNAKPGSPREKFASIEELLEAVARDP